MTIVLLLFLVRALRSHPWMVRLRGRWVGTALVLLIGMSRGPDLHAQEAKYGLHVDLVAIPSEGVWGLSLTMGFSESREADSTQGGVTGLGLGLPLTGPRYVRGVGIGLLGAVSVEEWAGIGVGGLVIGSDRGSGLFVGGLFAGWEELHGVGVAGLALGAEDVYGLVASPVVLVRANAIGLLLGGSAVTAELRGVAVGLVRAEADDVRGILVGFSVEPRGGWGWAAGAAVEVPEGRVFSGLLTGAITQAKGEHHGLAIGIINTAARLRGVQIGLLNYAGNNPRGLRWLPLLNAHF